MSYEYEVTNLQEAAKLAQYLKAKGYSWANSKRHQPLDEDLTLILGHFIHPEENGVKVYRSERKSNEHKVDPEWEALSSTLSTVQTDF
jgi:hypothetical protein